MHAHTIMDDFPQESGAPDYKENRFDKCLEESESECVKP
jgi:hypothetical protein